MERRAAFGPPSFFASSSWYLTCSCPSVETGLMQSSCSPAVSSALSRSQSCSISAWPWQSSMCTQSPSLNVPTKTTLKATVWIWKLWFHWVAWVLFSYFVSSLAGTSISFSSARTPIEKLQQWTSWKSTTPWLHLPSLCLSLQSGSTSKEKLSKKLKKWLNKSSPNPLCLKICKYNTFGLRTGSLKSKGRANVI